MLNWEGYEDQDDAPFGTAPVAMPAALVSATALTEREHAAPAEAVPWRSVAGFRNVLTP